MQKSVYLSIVLVIAIFMFPRNLDNSFSSELVDGKSVKVAMDAIVNSSIIYSCQDMEATLNVH